MLVRSICGGKKNDIQALAWLLIQFYRTKHLELKYCSEVSWNCTNIDAVIFLNVCILAHGSYLWVVLKIENNTCR